MLRNWFDTKKMGFLNQFSEKWTLIYLLNVYFFIKAKSVRSPYLNFAFIFYFIFIFM